MHLSWFTHSKTNVCSSQIKFRGGDGAPIARVHRGCQNQQKVLPGMALVGF